MDDDVLRLDDRISKSDKLKSKHGKNLNKRRTEVSTTPEYEPTIAKNISKIFPLLSPLPVVKSTLPLDKRVSVASSLEEPSRKSSIDEAPTVLKDSLFKNALPVESDWSSEEEFKSSTNVLFLEPKGHLKMSQTSVEGSTSIAISSAKDSEVYLRESTPEDDHIPETNRRVKETKHLPRTYQVDEICTSKKETKRFRGSQSSKHYFGILSSPSPPAPTHGSYRKRPRYASQEQHERSRHRRSRPHSPILHSHHKRSKSPPRIYSIGFKGKSPSPR